MRPHLPLASACIAAVLLLDASAVWAETASGWVDPPARDGTEKPSEAARPEVTSPETKQPKAVRTPAVRVETDGRPSHDRRQADRERRETHHRMSTSGSEIDAGASDSRVAGWAGRAQRFTEAYLASVSSPNEAMLAAAPGFYGERVRFHGRTLRTSALIAEKRRFVRRWPERRYAPQDRTMRTDCQAVSATCTVRTVMDFRAENPARGARSRGSSELTLTVGFSGQRPVIIAETSRVLRRGSAALGASRHGDGA